ncbi:GEVED domain-containing protein [Actinosynnema sp. NPDC047251]|uniref:DUF11 domain-containing protein n=1 Tax=Saccharothrix espanaensis (strain ATCC 51144 / DSM 44229 / JCM 9112 / NBRC 15066 / NRRL 15764) TaxID=1179773 RepID=K0K6W2_SACES|nr:GEVED domain-containing protein [Saccharothrix espanaensis]CCH33272.1 hypothetical protein BN6_60160 [Saccharothrix espanaensis DSM 44229]
MSTSPARRLGSALSAWLIALAGVALVAPAARGYQTHPTTAWTSSSALPSTYANATSALPSGVGVTVAVAGDKLQLNNLNSPPSVRGGTAANFTPQIPANTALLDLITVVDDCAAGSDCYNRGTITLTFTRPLRNPVLHVVGIGGTINAADSATAALTATTPGVTLEGPLAGATNLTVVGGARIESANRSANTACNSVGARQATAGCGSVRMLGTVSSVSFAVYSYVNGGQHTPDAFSLGISADEDFGDAPASYDPGAAASHVVGGPVLGTDVSADNTTTQNTGTVTPSPKAVAAGADNNLPNGDTFDDGVAGFPRLASSYGGLNYTVPVTLARTTSAGRVCGWIDFDRDGVFDNPGERACADFAAGATSANITWVLPATIGCGFTYARFRAGFNTTQVQSPTGLADSGEVEDYRLPIECLRIRKTADKAVAAAGEKVTYTVTVANQGVEPLGGVIVEDDLTAVLDDANFNNDQTATPAGGTFTYTAPRLRWTGTVAAGQTITLTYSVTLKNPVTGDHQLRNAVLSNAGNCVTGTQDPDCRTVVNAPGMTIEKKADKASANPGEVVTYTVTVRNVGQTSLSANFSDNLSQVVDDATWGGVTASTGTATYTAPNLNWSGTLAVGATATITYTVTVTGAGNRQLDNVVTSTTAGSNCAAGSADARCRTSTPVAGMTIDKKSNRATANPGDVVTYTVTVTNTGKTVLTGATFSDDLTAVLDDANWGSASATLGTVSFTSPTLTWNGNLAVGASATVTYTVTVKNPVTGNFQLDNVITSTTAGSNCPAGSADARCRTSTPVAGLQVAKAVDRASANPGDVVTYTVTVRNTGKTALTGATFSDNLGGVLDDANWGSASATAGTATFTAPNLVWTGDLAVGATATITYTVTVQNPVPGDFRLANVVTSSTAGSNCPAGSTDPVCRTSTAVSGLDIAKTVDKPSANPGDVVTYTVTVRNTGQTPQNGATFTDDLAGVLDDATWIGASASTGTATFTAPNLVWTGNLAVGASATVTYTARVTGNGDKRLANTVTSTTPGNNCPAGSSDPKCRTSTPLSGVTIAKAVDRTSADPGDTVTYTVTVTNTGQTPLNANFSDDLSGVLDDATWGSATASTGTVTFTSPNLAWSGSLAVGATATITYTVTVKEPVTGDFRLDNVVTSTTPGSNCPTGSTDARCKTSTPIAGLRIVKSDNRDEVVPGDTVTYTIVVTNTGQTPQTGATFTDDLSRVIDDATYNADAAATAGSVSYTAPNLTWTGDLAVGASATVTYTVTVLDPDPGDKRLVNQIVSTTRGSNCPAGSTDPSCSTATPGRELTFSKTSDKQTANPGETVTYTVTVTNTGQVPLSNATFADDLSDVLDDATWGSVTASTGTATFASPNLNWTGSLEVGASATVTYTVTVKNPTTGNHELGNAVSSTEPGNCPPGSTDPACSTTTLLPGLEITKTVDKPSANPGDTVTYTVTVRNSGTTPQDANFSDDLSGVLDDATWGSVTASTGTVTFTSPNLAWTGALAVGATATVTYTVIVQNPPTGDFTLGNAVTSTTPGGNCPAGSTDPRCGTTTPVSGIDLTKSVDRTDAKPGDVVTYTVLVRNTGTTPLTAATFSDNLADVVDDATWGGATATTGTAAYAEPTLTWTGDVPVGGTATITYTVTVKNPPTGDFRLANVVTSSTPGGNCPAGSTDPDCTTSTPVAGLGITKTAAPASVKPGDTVTYTVVVANTGQTVHPGATFTDDLTGVVDDATYNADAAATLGTTSYTAPRLTWTGDLAVGATATITYTVTVKNPVPGDFRLANAVTSSTPGSNCPTGTTDPKCSTSTPVAGLDITKTAAPATPEPGATVTYTVTVRNTGQTPQNGARFTDDLTDVLDDGAYNADGTATVGAVTYAEPVLTWTGDLPVGSQAVVTYSVRVDDPPAGDHRLRNAVTSDVPGANCPPGSTDPKCSTSTPLPGMEIKKTVDRADAKPGDVVTYTVVVRNTGQTALTGATAADDLTGVLDDATWGSASATLGTATFAAPRLTWTGDLAVGATATITYTVTVQNPVTGDYKLVNDVRSTTPGAVCITCTTTTPIAGLSIEKKSSPATVNPGDVVTYTVTVTNTGQTVQTGVSFTDDLTRVLDDADYGNDGTATVGSVSYAAPNLTWTGTLAIGASATVTYTVRVKNPNPGDKQLTNVVTSDSPGSNCPTGSTDPKCSTSTAGRELTIQKTSDKQTANPGETVTYTLTVTNSGQVPLTPTTVTDDLSDVVDDATWGSATASTGTATFASPTLTWTGDLAPGGTATITYTVTVNDPITGNRALRNAVSSTTPGNCPPGSTDPRCSTTTSLPGLEIAKSVDKPSAKPGDTVTYTVALTNTGQTSLDASFSDNLSGVLDDATWGSVSASTGTATFTAPNLAWSGTLPVGGTATVTYTVTVNNPVAGDFLLGNAVTSTTPGNNCPSGSTDPKCSTSTPLSGLEITKVVDKPAANPGDTVTYTVTVRNTGKTPQDASFTDDLSGVLDDATWGSATASTGTATFTAPNLAWSGTLGVGESAIVTYTVTVTGTGDKTLGNVVTSDSPGSNCPPGSTDPKCSTSTPLSGVRFEKSVDRQQALPGDTVTYTVTVTNTGNTALTGATFTDDLSGVLDDATWGSATATTGTAAFTAPNLTWTGDLAIGGTATVTYAVRVENPVSGGDFQLDNAVTSTTPGANCPADAAACRTSTPISALRIVKTDDRDEVLPGDTVRYTIAVINTGKTPITGATFTDDLTQVLDDADYNGDAVANTGTVTYTAPRLTWTGDLAIGESASVTYTVTVKDPDPGDKKLVNRITSDTPGGNCAAGSTDPSCGTETPGRELSIAKSVDKQTANPGDTLTYTVVLTNTGQVPLTGAVATDDLTDVVDDATYGSATATTGTVTYAAPRLTWTGDLAVGASATVTYTVTVNNPITGNHELANVVSSDTPGNCPPDSDDPPCRTSTPLPGLEIVKSAGQTSAKPGDTVTYTVTVRNTGKTPQNATFSDDLTQVVDDAAFGSASATTGTATYAAPKLTWTGALAVGETATITYTVTVNDPVTGDFTLTNVIVSDTPGGNCPPGSTDPKCSTVTPIAGLSIEKTSSPATVKPGDTVTYTVTVRNTGQTAQDDATFTDDLSRVVDDADYANDGTATTGSVVYAAPNLTWVGDLPVGGTATVTYTVQVKNPITGDHRLTNVVSSGSPGTNCPPGSTDPKCSTDTALPGLEITKTADKADAKPGDTVTYTVTVANTGQTPQNASFTDDLTQVVDDATYGSASATSGAVTYTAPRLTWTGALAVGATATITYTVTVNDPVTGDFRLTNAIVSDTPGTNCPPGSTDPKCAVVTPIAGLVIEKKSSPATVNPGDTVTYTVTVRNTGQTAQAGATFTDDLSQVLDDADYNNDGTATTGTVAFTAPELTWTGDLPIGATATVTYSVRVKDPIPGDHRLTNVVGSDTPGTNCPLPMGGRARAVDPRCSTDTALPGMTITKVVDRADAKPGDVVTYKITVANTGRTALDASFSDDLTQVVDDAAFGSASATTGTATYTAPKLVWSGALVAGATAEITYTVTVNNPVTGDFKLTNAVTSDTPGHECVACTTVTPIAGLSIEKTSSPATVKPGDTVTYTVAVRNTGQTVQAGATFTDDLAQVIDDATYNDDATVTGPGTAGYAPPELTWTGDLPIGATATITYSATVNSPVTGDHALRNVVRSTSAGNNCPPGSTDPKCGTLTELPGLIVEKTASSTTAAPGERVTYTVVVTNTGQTAQDASFADDLTEVLDDAAYNADATATAGMVDYAAPALRWSGRLAVGAKATVTYSVTVGTPATGDLRLVNAVGSDTPGSNCPLPMRGRAGEVDPRCSATVLVPRLAIVKTVDRAEAKPGEPVTYTVVVANTGQVDLPAAQFTDDLGGVLDDAEFLSASATTGTSSFAAPTLTWTGQLPVGATSTVTYRVKVADPPTGDFLLRNVVTSDTPGRLCPGPDCGTTTPVAGLEIVKAADREQVRPGDRVTYTVTLRNTGRTPLVGAGFFDSLVGVLDDATFEGASEGAVYQNPVLSWTGDIAVGGTATVTYSVTVTGNGDKDLTNTVISDTPGANCRPGGDDPRCSTRTAVEPAPPIASTGALLLPWLLGGLLLLLVGGGLVFMTRRARR